MTPTPLHSLRLSLSTHLATRLATLLVTSRRRAIREATRRALTPFGPALREDLGLTHHSQSIIFQNDKHQKHSFD